MPEIHFIIESYTPPELFLTTLFTPIEATAAVPATATPPTINPTQPTGVATTSRPSAAAPTFTTAVPVKALAAKLLDSMNNSRSHSPPALYSL